MGITGYNNYEELRKRILGKKKSIMCSSLVGGGGGGPQCSMVPDRWASYLLLLHAIPTNNYNY